MISTYYATVKDANNVLVENKDGCTNLCCMDISGNTLYCIKINKDKNKGYLYKYTYNTTKKVWGFSSATLITGAIYDASGMAYSENVTSSGSVDKALMIACNTTTANSKFVKMSLTGKVIRSYSCAPAGYTGKFGAITKHKNNEFIVMANGKNTTDSICLMRGKFNKTNESFDILETFYVRNRGYQAMKDIYYNPSAGLFISTHTNNSTSCRNVILQVDYDGLYMNKPANAQYEAVDRLAVIKSTTTHNDYQVESISVGSTKRFVGVANIVKADGKSADAIIDFSNISIG